MIVMDYVGYNGRMTVQGEILTLTHDGFTAKAGGLSTGQPRRIPLQAISAVTYRPASRVTNGWITLGLGGASAAELGAGTAASNPDTVMFRRKDNGLFESLFVWLQTVVSYNRDHQIDSSNVAFDTAPPTRKDRSNLRAEDGRAELKEDLAPKQKDLAPKLDDYSPLTQAPTTADLSSDDQGLATPRPAIPSPTTPATVPVPPRGGRRQRAAERQSFEELAMSAALGDATALQQLPAALADTRANWRKGKLDAKLWDTLVAAVRQVGADDVMTAEEEAHLSTLATALGLDFMDLRSKAPAAFEEVVVWRINDGRPPTLSDPPILTKRGEMAYASFGASLMKEVARREYRGGGSSVSIPLGGGVRYRVGNARGKSVIVGTDIVTDDSGIIVITSTRTLFTGQKKTLEFRHDRLVGIQQYKDGLRLNVSNRQTASLFKFSRGDSPTIAAALISSAVSNL